MLSEAGNHTQSNTTFIAHVTAPSFSYRRQQKMYIWHLFTAFSALCVRQTVWEVAICQSMRNVPTSTTPSTPRRNSSFFVFPQTFWWHSFGNYFALKQCMCTELFYIMYTECLISCHISHIYECTKQLKQHIWYTAAISQLQYTINFNYKIGCFVFQSLCPAFTVSSERRV